MAIVRAMSEFKFACPVCGQHITADSSNSGTQITCPTCFQAMVVPQAPVAGSSNLILSASQANKHRSTVPGTDLQPIRKHGKWSSILAKGLVLIVLCAGALAIYSMRGNLKSWLQKLGL